MRLVQWALAAALLLCSADSAHALFEVNPPTGWSAGRIYVTTRGDNTIWVVYLTGKTGSGTCTWTKIGNTTDLFQRTRIHGSSWGDEIRVLSGISTAFICNEGIGPVNVVDMKLEIYSWGGIDLVEIEGTWPSLQVHGGSGNDFIMIEGQAYSLDGDDGDDALIARSVNDVSTSVSMFGGNGADLFCAYEPPVLVMDGGPGADARWGFAPTMISIANLAVKGDCDAGRDFIIDELFH